MQTVLLSLLFGAVFTMVLWAAGSAAALRDRMMRRGGELFPPEES
jgi:type III secretory pathway component EscT